MAQQLLSLEWWQEISDKKEYRYYVTQHFPMVYDQIKGKKNTSFPFVAIIKEDYKILTYKKIIKFSAALLCAET